jgi:serine/threonine protein kinase
MIVPFNCPQCQARMEAEVTGLQGRLESCASCGASIKVPNVPVGPGVIIGSHYRLDKKVGESHLGEIYIANRDSEPVTVEILSGAMTSDDETVSRFLQEVDILSSLKHPNLLGAVEAGQDAETYFLVTAFETGMVGLNEALQKNGPLDENLALQYMINIAEVLQYTWNERKILHRDIKPQNIQVKPNGKAKLTGFAIAKSSEDKQSMGLTGVGFTIGTPEYMSPEQIKTPDDLDFRSDLYALGVVFYECLVGELPFADQAPILLMQKHMDEIPQPVISRTSRVSRRTSDLIDRMLAKERDQRFASWQALIDAMSSALGGVSAPATGSSPRAVPATNSSSGGKSSGGISPIVLGVGILLIFIIFILLIMLVRKG